MLKLHLICLLLLLALGTSRGADEFAGLKCGADIAKFLIGKHDSNDPVAAIEKRHADLNLKNLGGTEISDSLFLASWQICGSEYELLVNTPQGRIRDVLPFPIHSAAAPMFIGTCQADGKQLPGTTIAVPDNTTHHNPRDRSQVKVMLKATSAWQIDQAKQEFVKQSTEKLACPLPGIVTQDGGQ
jgi:hypothetical protein